MALRHHMRVAAVAATAACAAAACSFGGNGPIVTSGDLSGETTTEARQVDGFTEVAVGGGAELTVTEGDTYSVEVTTDSGLQQHITFDGGVSSAVNDFTADDVNDGTHPIVLKRVN